MYATEHVSYYEQLPKTLKQKPNERRGSGKNIEARKGTKNGGKKKRKAKPNTVELKMSRGCEIDRTLIDCRLHRYHRRLVASDQRLERKRLIGEKENGKTNKKNRIIEE